MDESGPRHTALKSPLIERADLQSPRQRTLYGALTLGFWVFWVYLWVPVLALLAWALGVEQAYKYMAVFGGYRDVINLLALYGLVILLLGGGLVLWAVYNILRFRNVEKRRAALPVTPIEIGQHFGQDPESVARWQSEQRLYVTHDETGRIAHVEALIDGAAVPI
jgi:biofilm PGA synthesis protein PgaD